MKASDLKNLKPEDSPKKGRPEEGSPLRKRVTVKRRGGREGPWIDGKEESKKKSKVKDDCRWPKFGFIRRAARQAAKLRGRRAEKGGAFQDLSRGSNA